MNISAKPISNSKDFLKMPAAIKKGLYFAILNRIPEIFSNGSIRLDNSRNIVPIEIEIIVTPSCVENAYPIAIPINTKNVIENSRIIKVTRKFVNKGLLRKSIANPIITIDWMITRINEVRYVEKIKYSGFVGVVKFLKKAFEVFSIIIRVPESRMPINIITSISMSGNRNISLELSEATGLTFVVIGETMFIAEVMRMLFISVIIDCKEP